jgi:hypothetical protein
MILPNFSMGIYKSWGDKTGNDMVNYYHYTVILYIYKYTLPLYLSLHVCSTDNSRTKKLLLEKKNHINILTNQFHFIVFSDESRIKNGFIKFISTLSDIKI